MTSFSYPVLKSLTAFLIDLGILELKRYTKPMVKDDTAFREAALPLFNIKEPSSLPKNLLCVIWKYILGINN